MEIEVTNLSPSLKSLLVPKVQYKKKEKNQYKNI